MYVFYVKRSDNHNTVIMHAYTLLYRYICGFAFQMMKNHKLRINLDKVSGLVSDEGYIKVFP